MQRPQQRRPPYFHTCMKYTNGRASRVGPAVPNLPGTKRQGFASPFSNRLSPAPGSFVASSFSLLRLSTCPLRVTRVEHFASRRAARAAWNIHDPPPRKAQSKESDCGRCSVGERVLVTWPSRAVAAGASFLACDIPRGGCTPVFYILQVASFRSSFFSRASRAVCSIRKKKGKKKDLWRGGLHGS